MKCPVDCPASQTINVIGTVAMALGKAKPEYIPFAPKSVHLATEEALQQLDPRFQVVSSYQRGVTEFQLLARESVTLRFSVDLHRAPDFQAKYRDFVKHGESIHTDRCASSVRKRFSSNRTNRDPIGVSFREV